MSPKNVRIKDIALKARVSTGTVDRVIHNRGRVSEEVRERILKIISEMKYEPNLMARALGSHKVYQIAALIPDHHYDSYWLAPKAGIEKAEKDLRQFGISVNRFAFNPYDAGSFIEQAEKVTSSHPDGIILSPIFYREATPFVKKWQSRSIPFVLFNTHIEEFNALSYIGQDSYQSGLLAGNLIHYGQPDPCTILIAHIDEEISNAAHLIKKEQGLRDYFKENELKDYTILKAELNRADPVAFLGHLDAILDAHPDVAIIFVTTSKAHVIAKYLSKRKEKQIRIIGYDLLPENIHFLNNGGISFLINQNPEGQGYWGIHQLTDHLVFKKEVLAIKYLPLDIVSKENLVYYQLQGASIR